MTTPSSKARASKARAVQYFTPEQLEHGKSLTPTQIAEFLEEFRLIHGEKDNPQAAPASDGHVDPPEIHSELS